jgi:hypothetical protein
MTIRPFDVAAWVKELREEHSTPGVKEQLAAVRMLFDRLITGQVVPTALVQFVCSCTVSRFGEQKAGRWPDFWVWMSCLRVDISTERSSSCA